MSAPVITNIDAYGGEYSLKLLSQVMNSFDVVKDCTMDEGIPYKKTLTKIKPVNGARPYRLQEDFVDSPNFTDRVIEVFRGKKDFQIETEKYRTTYLNLAKSNKLDPDEIPYWDFHIMMEMKSVLAEINDATAYSGVRNGSGTGAVDIANGFGTILAAEILASAITPETLGTIDGSNALTKFQTLYRSIPEAWRKTIVELYCSYTDFDFYRDSIPAAKNVMWVNTNNPDSEEVLWLPDSNKRCRIVPCTWMNGSRRIIITPKDNLIVGLGQIGGEPTLEMIRALSSWKCRLNYFVGFQIADTDAIFCNETV